MSVPLTESFIAVGSILQGGKPEERNGQSSESKDENGEKKSHGDSEGDNRFDTRNQPTNQRSQNGCNHWDGFTALCIQSVFLVLPLECYNQRSVFGLFLVILID